MLAGMYAVVTIDGRAYVTVSPLPDAAALADAIHRATVAGDVTWHHLAAGGALIVNWRAVQTVQVDAPRGQRT